MSGFLIDTNCISELFRIKPDANVTTWIEDAEESLLYLSVSTLGEIRKGLASLPQDKRRSQVETWLEVELHARFRGRILPIDVAVADRWGLLTANARAKGKPLSTIDALLAATAIQHDLTLVSRNVRDFAHVPVPVPDPWES